MKIGLGIGLTSPASLRPTDVAADPTDQPLLPPDGFTFTPPFNIYETDGVYTDDFNKDNYKPAAAVVYYVSPSGDDENDGLSEAAPLASIATARLKTDCDGVIVASGFYDDENGFDSSDPDRDQYVICPTGKAISIKRLRGLTWVLDTDDTYFAEYEDVRPPVGVIDASSAETSSIYSRMRLQTSIANVKTDPGSFFPSPATTPKRLYVKLLDSREPDGSVWPIPNEANFVKVTAADLYRENIEFVGGSCPSDIRPTNPAAPTVVDVNCGFIGSMDATAAGGFLWQGGGLHIAKSCYSSLGRLDGFNYHGSTLSPDFALIDVDAGWTGIGSGGTNNSITSHEEARGIILRGRGVLGQDRNIHMIDTTQTWVLGTEMGPSRAASGATKVTLAVGFPSGGDATEMWVENPTFAAGSDYDIACYEDAHLYLKGVTQEEFEALSILNYTMGGAITDYEGNTFYRVPVLVTPGSISGDAQVLEVLTYTPAVFDGFPTPTSAYQWQHEVASVWTDIVGETTTTLVVPEEAEGNRLRMEETSTNIADDAVYLSDPTDEVEPPEAITDPDAETLFARMPANPDATVRSAITNCIIALKAASLWTPITSIGFLGIHDLPSGILNWKGGTDAVLIGSGHTFDDFAGYTGDGSTSKINLGVDFSGAQNGAFMGVGSLTSGQVAVVDMGNNNSLLTLRSAADNCSHRINCGTSGTAAAQSDARGIYITSRTGVNSGDNKAYKNGTQLAASSSASTTPDTTNKLHIGGRSGSAPSFSTRKFAFWIAGNAGLDATQVANLTTILKDCAIALSIPTTGW